MIDTKIPFPSFAALYQLSDIITVASSFIKRCDNNSNQCTFVFCYQIYLVYQESTRY